jgi:hypothetical protein
MNKEYFWSIAIESGQVQAAIWTLKDKSAQIVTIAPPENWEDPQDLVQAVDGTLSSATQSLDGQEEIEPTQTVFGVAPYWVSEGRIKKEYLEKIKEICDKLSLVAKGFVILPEAISNYIKTEEEVPVNAVIIGIGESVLDISVFRLGNLIGTVNVARSLNLIDDVVEGLVRFETTDPLPSRFIIYNGRMSTLEEAKETLIKADWTDEFKDKVKFLHTPQVEIVSSEKKLTSVCLAGAFEIGQVSSIKLEEPKEEAPQSKIQELGFAVGEDVGQSALSTQEELPAPVKKFSKIKIPKLHLSMPNFVISGGRNPLVFLSVSFFILVLGLIAAWIFLPRADITIYVSPKKLDARTTITIDPSAEKEDFDKKVLPAKLVEVKVEGDKTQNATGTKIVGDSAKGQITLRNGTSADLELPQGTVVTSTGNLKFTLDSEASVSGAVSPASPGTVTVGVTAANIGAEYNIAKDETFKVGNYPKSEVDAVAIADFTGGSSRQIVAVGESDIKSLKNDLTKELLNKADQKMKEGLQDSEILVSESKVATPASEIFDHKVGDEADNLKLNLSLNVSAFVVSKKTINQFALSYLKDQVPGGYVLKEGQIETNFLNSDDSQSNSNTRKFDTIFTVNLLPEIKPDEIAQKIAGKYPKVALSYMTGNIGGFVRAEIHLKPALPGKLGILPKMVKHISITVTAEK